MTVIQGDEGFMLSTTDAAGIGERFLKVRVEGVLQLKAMGDGVGDDCGSADKAGSEATESRGG